LFEQYDALIFDMDGTLVDSMPLHLDAWQITCEEFQLSFDRALLNSYGGIPTRKIVAMLAEQQGVTIDIDAFVRRKIDLYLQHIGEVTLFPAMAELVRAQYGKIPMGIGTGAPRDQAQQILRNTGLDALIPVLISADDVQNHKPNPDTFLKVAERLGVAPHRCLVFEDTEIGIQAGKAAGMATILATEGMLEWV
jgi:beta-phosphoglucomutase family hydrolase